MGFEVEERDGGRKALQTAQDDSEASAVVWLRSNTRARIWMERQDNLKQRPVDVYAESSDALALRSSEQLRARLLPQGDESSPLSHESSGPLLRERGAAPYSVTAGPGIGLGNESGPHLMLGARLLLPVSTRLALGPFVLAALTPSDWTPDDRLSVSPLFFGLQGSVRLLDAEEHPFQLSLLGYLGARSLFLRVNTGPPANQPRGALIGPAFGLGMGCTYRLMPHLSVGADLNTILSRGGISVLPETTSGPPAVRASLDSAREFNAWNVHVTSLALLIVDW